jgi:hypothetical protein
VEDKESAVQILLSCPEGQDRSNRWVADECKVSDHVVARVRRRMASVSNSGVNGESRLGRDGKWRKVKETSQQDTQVQANGEPNTTTETKPSVPMDSLGMPLSGDMVEVFKARELFAKARSLLRQYSRLINELAHLPGGAKLKYELTEWIIDNRKGVFKCDYVRKAYLRLKNSEPYASVCPYCYVETRVGSGEKCRCGCGWATEREWLRASEQIRTDRIVESVWRKGHVRGGRQIRQKATA